MDFAKALAESMGLSDSPGADSSDEAPQEVAVTAAPYSPAYSAVAATTDFDAQAAEVERRLRMASLYNAVLQESFFDGDDPLTAEVDAEFREFATKRRAALLGVAVAETRYEFTPEQVEVLTDLAALGTEGVSILVALVKMMRANAGVQAQLKAQPPRPSVAKPKPPVAPAVRKHKVATTKSAARPAPPPPAPVQASRQPAPKVVQAPKRPGEISIPPEGAIYEDGGEKYLAKHVEITPDEFGPQVTPTVEALQPGQAMKIPTGQVIFRDPDGTLKKLVPSRRSGQRRSSKAGVPFPTDPNQVAAMVTAQAHQVAAAAEDGVMGRVINATLR